MFLERTCPKKCRRLDERVSDIGPRGLGFTLIDRIRREGLDEVGESSSIRSDRREDKGLSRKDDEAKLILSEHAFGEDAFGIFDARREDIIGFHRFRNIESNDGLALGRGIIGSWTSAMREERIDEQEREEEYDQRSYPPEQQESKGSASMLFHEGIREGFSSFLTQKKPPNPHEKE